MMNINIQLFNDGKSKNNIIGKEELIYILDRTIGFIRNCDNKASVLLGIVGVLVTIVFSTNIIGTFKTFIAKSYEKVSISGCSAYTLYLVVCIISVTLIIYGIYNLYLVMNVKLADPNKLNKKIASLIFFEGINKHSDTDYKNKISSMTNEQYIDDVISQIYINADICSAKYVVYKKSLRYLSCGSLVLFFWYVIGVMIF